MIEISWAAVGGVCAFVMAALTVLGFWMRFSDRMTAAETAATTAHVEAVAAKLKADILQRDFTDYQTKAAGMFITDSELGQTERRISAQVEEIKTDIRGMNTRLDRVLEERGKP
jgi:hypothetical protein